MKIYKRILKTYYVTEPCYPLIYIIIILKSIVLLVLFGRQRVVIGLIHNYCFWPVLACLNSILFNC